MLMVDAVTPVVVPPCGRPHAPPAAGWPPPGTDPLPVPPLLLLTVPPLLLPPTATVPGPLAAPGLVPPGPGTVVPPGTVPPGAPGTPLLAAAMAAGDPDLRVAVASGLSPQAVVSAVRAMAPASSCRPVRGRFIVVSELRGAGRSGIGGECGAVTGGTAKDAVEAAGATCADGLLLRAKDHGHQQQEQREGCRAHPEGTARHGRRCARVGNWLQLRRRGPRDLRWRRVVDVRGDPTHRRYVADGWRRDRRRARR